MNSKITMDELKKCIKDYCAVDDEIRRLNKYLYEKRDNRKTLELQISEIVESPAFEQYNKFQNSEDGSYIRIQRPQTYSKPWSLSKKDLQDMLNQYFSTHQNLSSTECFEFIQTKLKEKLLAHEFSFTRVVSNDENM